MFSNPSFTRIIAGLVVFAATVPMSATVPAGFMPQRRVATAHCRVGRGNRRCAGAQQSAPIEEVGMGAAGTMPTVMVTAVIETGMDMTNQCSPLDGGANNLLV